MPISPAERAAISYCLAAYIDNESDKSDGIGSELLESLQGTLLFCADGDGDVLEISLVQLAHLRKALETYQEDPAAGEEAIACLISRIDRAVPAMIPPEANR